MTYERKQSLFYLFRDDAGISDVFDGTNPVGGSLLSHTNTHRTNLK